MTVGCIYCHPHRYLNEFNNYYLNNLFDKISKENKTVFHLSDFNKDFSYDQRLSNNECFKSLSSHILLTGTTRIRNNSETLIDNLYSNVITPNNISDSLT